MFLHHPMRKEISDIEILSIFFVFCASSCTIPKKFFQKVFLSYVRKFSHAFLRSLTSCSFPSNLSCVCPSPPWSEIKQILTKVLKVKTKSSSLARSSQERLSPSSTASTSTPQKYKGLGISLKLIYRARTLPPASQRTSKSDMSTVMG